MAAPVINSVTGTNGSSGCANSGAITVSATGTGTLFYAVKKSTDAQYSPKQTSNVFTRLVSGIYTIMVYDDNGQTQSTPVTITNKDNITPFRITSPPIATSNIIACTESGMITINADWGQKPYTFRILSGPTSRPDIVTQASSNVSFTGLSTGYYNASASDNCGTTFYLNNIYVVSHNVSGRDFEVFELDGPVSWNSVSCGISFTRDIKRVYLKDASGDTLYRYGTDREMPTGYPIDARVEYPAGSGLFTAWGSITSYNIPSAMYQPGVNAYRIQVRNPCNAADLVFSPVYQLINPYNWRQTVCGYEIYRQLPNYFCGSVQLKLSLKTNPAQQYTFTWNGSGSSYMLDMSGVPAGLYDAAITTGTHTYAVADFLVGAGGMLDVGMVADIFNYPMNLGCDFTTGGIRVTNIPAGNIVPVTYTILSGPVTRPPVTNTQNITLWNDLPKGAYTIQVNRGGCGTSVSSINLQPPFSGFNATLSYKAGYMCGLYKITGKGWYLDANGNVSTLDAPYGVSIFNATTGLFIGAVAIEDNNTAFESSIDVPPGNYRVSFASGTPTVISCRYIDRFITISAPAPLAVDPATTGGAVCTNGRGTLHIGISGGGGQPAQYRIRPASSSSESDYTPYQSSPDFPNLAPGTYTVQITDNCETVARNVTFAAAGIVSQIDVSGSICQGSNAVLKLNAVGAVSNVSWTRPGGGMLSGQTVTVPRLTPADAGLYTVTFNSSGCAWSNSTTLTVNPKPEFSFAPDTVACQPVNLQNLPLKAGNSSGVSMAYYNNIYQPVANPAQANTGVYRIVGTNGFGCTDTSTVAVTVNPVATAAIIATTPVTVCSGTAGTLKAQPAVAGTIVNPVFRWYADQNSSMVLGTGANYSPGPVTVATTTTLTFYVSVQGDNYCENQPGDRKAVNLTIRQIPTVKIRPLQDTTSLCHNATIALKAETTGSILLYWWRDSKGLEGNTTQYAPDPGQPSVVYQPNISEAGKTIELSVKVREQYCGYYADTIRLRILPLPVLGELNLVTQPKVFQEMCVDTIYEVKILASKQNDMKNIRMKLADINANLLTLKTARYKYPYTTGAWTRIDSVALDGTGKTWAISNALPRGDSALFQVKVAAECGFYSGTNMAFNLNADNSCGIAFPQKAVYTNPFNTKQDTAKLNTYEFTDSFSHDTVTNNTGNIVTWRLQTVVHGEQPTNIDKEAMYVMIPKGLTAVPNSFRPIKNVPLQPVPPPVTYDWGDEYVLPIKPGLVEGDTIIAELQFSAAGAPCGQYDFYSEIVFSDSIDCSGTKCTFNSTRGGAYPTLIVERYEFSLTDDVYGQTVNQLWSGNIRIKAETNFYAGDNLDINFYVDRNSNMTPEPGELVKSFVHTTTNVPAQGTFTVNFTGVPAEPQKQLLAIVTGPTLCEPAMLPIATLAGTDTVCEQDTALYYTSPGQKNYKWLVIKPIDAVSGATPVRIPLEGSSADNYINENIARVVWKKKGDYTIWTQYSLTGTNPLRELNKTYFPVHINERPIVALTGAADTTICKGTRVELSHFFRETTHTGTLVFYRVETDGSLTPLPASPLYIQPSENTVYRVAATCIDNDCESLNMVDFRIKVNETPQIGSVRVVTQPDCGMNTGSIQVSVTGGSGSYTYSLNNLTAYNDLPANGIIGNMVAGGYRVYIKDKVLAGCSPSISEVVSLSSANSGFHATAQTTPASTCTSNDGSITLTVNGGVQPYQYRLNSGSYINFPGNGFLGNNFAAGTYIASIIDAAGCTTSTAGEIHVNAATGINLSLVQASPAGCKTDGTLDLTLSGGTPAYSYRLSGQAWTPVYGSSATLSLSAGSHEIYARDASGCEISGVANIANAAGVSATLAGTTTAPCSGAGGGSITVNISGAAPLTYSIDGGKTSVAANAGATVIPNLAAGTYQVLVIDGGGCTATLEDVSITREVDFLQAVDNNVYTYMNQQVEGHLTYDDFENKQQQLKLAGHSSAQRGFISITSNGKFTYIPGTDFVGKDSVQYSIVNLCGFFSTAWLHIYVQSPDATVNQPPVAMDDEFVVQAGQTLANFDVKKNDSDPDGDALSAPVVVTGVTRGMLTSHGNGIFSYTSYPNFVGVDIFTYRICDSKGACSNAQVHIAVLPADVINSRVMALPDAYSIPKYTVLNVINIQQGILGNDMYPVGSVPVVSVVDSTTHGTININTADGTFTYTPDLHYSGFDGFTYALCANTVAKCDTARANIFITERPCPMPVTWSVKDTLYICQADSVNLATAVLPSSANIDRLIFHADRSYQSPLSAPYAKTGGMYYIEAMNTYQCSKYDSVYVQVKLPLGGTRTVGNLPGADFATLKQAADRYNTCGIASHCRLIIVSDLTETATAEFLGTAPGSALYTLTITSDGTHRTVSGAINGPLVKLTGANNIVIDGQQAGNPPVPLLSFVNTYATASANVRALSIVRNGASSGGHVRVRNSGWSLVQKNTAGGAVISASVDSVFIENSYIHDGFNGIDAADNTLRYAMIRNNTVAGLNLHGIRLLPAPVANITVTGNTVKDIAPTGAGAKTIGILVQHATVSSGAWNISGNRIGNIRNLTAFDCTTTGIRIDSNNANIQCNNNVVDGLTNNSPSTGGYGLTGIGVLQQTGTGAGTLQMANDTVRNLASDSYVVAFESSRTGTTGNGILQKLVAANLSGKTARPNFYDVMGIFLGGKGNIESATITGLRNTSGSATGILAVNSVSGNIVSNCMVSDIIAPKAMGISAFGTLAIYHNTVRLTAKANDTDEATAVNIGDRYQGASTTVTLQNNLLSNEVPGGAAQNFIIKRQTNAAISTPAASNNRYNIVNGNIAIIVTSLPAQTGVVHATLAGWATVTGDNSTPAIPAFAGATNLHLTAFPLGMMVPVISGITTDFDGDARTTCNNFAGADNNPVASGPLNGLYTIGNVPGTDFANLKQAADVYNICGLSGNTTFSVVSDLTETSTADFLGTAPGSATYKLTITPDGTRRTVSGPVNGALVKFTAANNIIIDGQQAATAASPTACKLAFANTHTTAGASVGALRVDKNGAASGKYVRVRNAEFSLATQQMAVAGGTALNFLTDSVFVEGCYAHHANVGIGSSGNKHAYVYNNVVTNVEAQGIYLVPAAAATSMNVSRNTVKDLASAGVRTYMTGIRVETTFATGTWSITDNHITGLKTTGSFENCIDGMKILGSASMTISNNVVENLDNNAPSTGYALRGIYVVTYTTGTAQISNDTVRNLTSESYAVGVSMQNLGSAAPILLRKSYTGNITGKGVRSDLYNSIGVHTYGQVALEANTVAGIVNTAGSAIGIRTTSSNSSNISNNMVSAVAGKPGIGISVRESSPNIYHNTVRLTSKLNDADEATAMEVGDRVSVLSPNLIIRNNLFSNEVAGGAANNFIIKRQLGAIIINANSSNNRYYIINGNVAMAVADGATQTGTTYKTLPAWTTATGDNSLMSAPAFAGATNLHLTAPSPTMHVPLIAAITTDFDGDPRTACSNAAGADNFTTPAVFTFSQPAITYAACVAKIAFETTGGTPAFQYSFNGTTYAAAVVDSATSQGNRAVHFNIPVANSTYTFTLRDANNCAFASTSSFTITPYPAPVINAVDNACTGDRLVFDTGATYSLYQWSASGTGGVMEGAGTAAREYFTWSLPGTKTVSVSTTDPQGCVKTATKNIVIYLHPGGNIFYRIPNTP